MLFPLQRRDAPLFLYWRVPLLFRVIPSAVKYNLERSNYEDYAYWSLSRR